MPNMDCPERFPGLISCNGALLAKLIAAKLVKKFGAFYGNRSFITVST